MRHGDLSTMTPKTVKRQLEKKLSLEEKILDQSPWKEKMKELINTAQDIYEQEPAAPKSTKKENAKHPASETISNASNDDEKAGSKRKIKGKKSSEIVHSDSESESNETDHESIDEDAPPTKKSRTKKTATKKTAKPTDGESKSEETIKRLKSYINKCGVRKIWSKELAGCETANSQIAKLQSILRDLGVEGRPTVEKCEKIRSERELKAEIDSLSRDNILASEKRATRSVVPPVDAVEDTTEEVEVGLWDI
ncbi:hypothetical protein K450DRAFT_227897 [Umbelopsis ramanniana AG]|uniref:Uncharacterized protein n=1 Tax=Umbelopsis ramanniana AG TaxID=1314678 RepID=A0AAD5EFZ2_UMBRA|nr:uncharacterized protein K450DRAFT_227897 [Umbelopsis ramanniana AG]KAI8582206.1 hypothetical protein K450DRAFT_227897 [Umbelopsis ramanniana AG]